MLASTVIEEIKALIVLFVNHFPFFNCFLLIKAGRYVAHHQSSDHSGSVVSVTSISGALLLLSFNYNVADDNKFTAHFMINVVTVLNIHADMIDKGHTVESFNTPASQPPDWVNNSEVTEDSNDNNNDDDNDDDDDDKWGLKGPKTRNLLTQFYLSN